MKKKTVIIAVLVALAVLLFSQGSGASPRNKVESWEFYAAKETACYVAEYNGKHWLLSFDKPLKPFKKNEFISNVWVGIETYINANGVKTEFYIFEIEVGGVVFPIAVLAADLNRIIA